MSTTVLVDLYLAKGSRSSPIVHVGVRERLANFDWLPIIP